MRYSVWQEPSGERTHVYFHGPGLPEWWCEFFDRGLLVPAIIR